MSDGAEATLTRLAAMLAPPDPGIVATVLKAALGAALVAGAGAGVVVAETQLPGLDTLGTLGVTAVLAVLLFRYVFRLLENYRKDLAAARTRTDNLEEDLRKLGRSSGRKDEAIRELTEYAHRLRVFVIAAGANGRELPEPPEIKHPDTNGH